MIEINHVYGGKDFNFGKTEKDYAKYKDITPKAFMKRS